MAEVAHGQGVRGDYAFLRWERITRGDQRPYLNRLILFRSPWCGVYLHHFLAGDDVCLHDHPWAFVSVILWGGYFEWTQERPASYQCRWYGPGRILLRPAAWKHRVQLYLQERRDGTLRDRTAWTLVITGRKRRTWGFWTAWGWIPWYKYEHARHCPE